MAYTYQPELRQLSDDEALRALQLRYPGRVQVGPVRIQDGIDEVEAAVAAFGVDVARTRFDRAGYRTFLERAEYSTRYPGHYAGNFAEKSFEHFVVAELGGLSHGAVFVDVASEYSPLGEILERMYGCQAFSQDIMYTPGVQGNRIGSDASAIPVENGFFDLAAATCSIEHFEGDADVRFMNEMQRTLRPGGKVVIAPLYICPRASVQTDPVYAVGTDVQFDADARICCAPGWGNRHGRFYSAETLWRRLVAPNPLLRFRVLRLVNAPEVDPTIYCRFVLEGTRLGQGSSA
jgi:SAM-dependent methyltransferase